MGFTPSFHHRIGDDSTEGKVPSAIERIDKLMEIRKRLTEHWAHAVESQKRNYDRKHQGQEFKRGQLVVLSTKNLRLRAPCNKMAPKFVGPFRILDRVGSLAYRLCLPAKYDRLHDVFPVSLLEPWHQREQSEPMPMPDLADDGEWEVEELRDKRRIAGEEMFLVKWVGWPSEYNQWVSREDLQNAPKLVAKFERDHSKRKRNRGAEDSEGSDSRAKRSRNHA